MKPYKLFFNMLLVFIAFGAMNLSCSKDDVEEIEVADPAIGTWYLRAVHRSEQTFDVTNEACFQDSRFVIDAVLMDLTLSIPDESGCQTQTIKTAWINENGTYYLVDENQNRQNAGILLNDNNQTLQMAVNANGEQVGLIFRK